MVHMIKYREVDEHQKPKERIKDLSLTCKEWKTHENMEQR